MERWITYEELVGEGGIAVMPVDEWLDKSKSTMFLAKLLPSCIEGRLHFIPDIWGICPGEDNVTMVVSWHDAPEVEIARHPDEWIIPVFVALASRHFINLEVYQRLSASLRTHGRESWLMMEIQEMVRQAGEEVLHVMQREEKDTEQGQ